MATPAATTDRASSPPSTHLRWSDLRAAAALSIDATRGITALVEGVHQAVRGRLGFAPGDHSQRTRGLTGAVYRSIDGIMAGIGGGLDAALKLLSNDKQSVADSDRRLAWLGVINGVIGDHLQASGSSLALPMGLHPATRMRRATPVKGTRIAVFIHGLCMSDQHWQSAETDRIDYGRALRKLGYTPLYLRYNTGLHISINGRQLAQVLQTYVDAQDASVDEICLIGHSMGGLIARSAAHYAEQDQLRWRASLKRMVFLGTPHHGSRLEQAGHQVDQLLAINRFTAPFTRLGGIRSSGIRDLRQGFLIDEHWLDAEQGAEVAPVPLPKDVRSLAIAATTGDCRNALSDHLTGDGLVPVLSALSQHADRRLCLNFDGSDVVANTSHLQLLRAKPVKDAMLHWLGRKAD